MRYHLQDRDWAQDGVLRPQNGILGLKKREFEDLFFHCRR